MRQRLSTTRTVRGHFDGKVVILEGPAPVSHTVSVVVKFPVAHQSSPGLKPRKFHWEGDPAATGGGGVDMAEELVRQRQAE